MEAEDLVELRDLLRPDVNQEAIDKLVGILSRVPATELATRHDLAELRGELLAEIGNLRAEIGTLWGELGSLRADMTTEIGSLRADMATEIGSLRADMATELGSVRAEMERSTKSIIRWLAGIVFPTLVGGMGATAAITAAIVA